MFDTLAPEMSGFNRVVLSNLWLFKPLLLREFEKSGATEAMTRTTTALTIFNAGNKDNVLPGNAAATVNFRLIPGDTQASVIDHVRSTVNNDRISIEPSHGNTDPPPVTGTASPSYQMLNRTIREIFPDVVVAPGLMVAATDSRHYVGDCRQYFPLFAGARELRRPEAVSRHQRAPQHRGLCRHDPVLSAADREHGGVTTKSSFRARRRGELAIAHRGSLVSLVPRNDEQNCTFTPPASAARAIAQAARSVLTRRHATVI